MRNYLITLCFMVCDPLQIFADIAESQGILLNAREDRKLFGGYRITPKFCKSTRAPVNPPGGPNICMFNYECNQRGGQVVGACMDGFLFGTCCQLPEGAMVGNFLAEDYPGVTLIDNKLSSKIVPTTHRTTSMYDITSHGVSQITASLLNEHPPFSDNGNILPTAEDNTLQLQAGVDNSWSTGGITHSDPDTDVNDENNEISSSYFSSTKLPNYTNKKTTPYEHHEETTLRYADTYQPPILQISVSNAPVGYTPLPTIQRPMFRPKPPKPTDQNYILIPTLTNKPNKTEDENVNLISPSTSSRPLTTFSYVSSSTPSNRNPTRKPPSTSYVYSTTIPPRRTESTTSKKSTTSRQPINNIIANSITSSKPPSTSYVYSSTFRPTSSKPNNVYSSTTTRPSTVAYSTFASTPEGFPGSQSSSTYRPSIVSSSIAGPGFTVTSQPIGQYSPYPSPAPTLIVLGPVDDEKGDGNIIASSSSRPTLPSRIGSTSSTTTQSPSQFPQRKPINHVTINNHVTQNIYSTQRPQTSSSSQYLASPTVIITPKPTISSTSFPMLEEENLESFVVTSTNDLINFPPDRNPNLNLSVPVISDEDITTPSFIEDEAMNEQVESFVNQIIYGLQEPFNDLKNIVYNKANVTSGSTLTTRKPTKKQGTTTKKPITKPNAVKVTTRRPVTTKRPGTTAKLTTTTTRKPAVTLSTIQNFIETETESSEIQQSYRDQCGIRPLIRNGRIVGGRGAQIGEFPWQVLVRESTWLGLFTKNKCGGVLISDKYVITAAHCQPGFLASLVAVFGEYDISGDLETRKPVSRNVKRVIVHRKYDAATFENDLALLELESPVKLDAHIIPICLPPDHADYAKQMATVTGWGRLKYGGGVPSVLQEVQVPIMENPVCQDMFRTAGHSKVILDSFLCAGYANGQKDACEGDSGGPLVVQRPDGRYELAGTVSHGIKCAAPYLPGVYMRTTYYKPWITSITGIE